MTSSVSTAPGDRAALAILVAEALRSDAPDDAVREVLSRLPWACDARLLVQCACVRLALFLELFTDSPRWVARTLVGEGRPGILLLRLFVAELPDGALRNVARLLAGWAVTSPHDFSALVAPLRAVRLRPATRFEVGFALWRLTWEPDADWFAWLHNGGTELAPLDLLTDAVPELLTATAAAAARPLVEALFDSRRLACWASAHLARAVERLLRLGGRGVLLLSAQLNRPIPPAPFRAELFSAAAESDDLSRVFRDAAADWLSDRRWIGSDPTSVDVAAARAACRVLLRAGPPAGVQSNVLDALEAWPALLPLATELLLAMGAGQDVSVRYRVVARIREDAKSLEEFDSPLGRRLFAFVEIFLALNPQWLEDILQDSHASRCLRVAASHVFAEADDIIRTRFLEAALRSLNDVRDDVRTEAIRWFRAVTPDPARYWPWLVAAVAVPYETPELIELFGQLPPDARSRAAAELKELYLDPNRAIAANARAALEALNSAG